MKGLAINDLHANCNVHIKLIDKNSKKVIETVEKHNAGMPALCNLLTEALVGNNISGAIPGYIVPTTKVESNGTITYTPIFTFGIPYKNLAKTDVPSTTNTIGYSYSTLTFLIESTFLSTGKSIDGFQLLSIKKPEGGNRTPMAEVILDAPLIIDTNTNLEVSWDINIKV